MNVVITSPSPKATYRSNAIPIKMLMTFFHRTRTNNPKIYTELQKSLNSRSNIEKEEVSCKYLTLSDIKLYFKATVVKTAWYWHKNRHTDQWYRTESTEINPYLYHQYLTDEASTYNRLKIVYSINGDEKIGQICAEI